MFGRRKHQSEPEGQQVPVDAALEGDIDQVEQAVAEYLKNPSDTARQGLLASLESLDAQTDQSDAYAQSVIGSAAFGYASKGEVLGETRIDSIVDEVSSTELNAQLALVKSAKNEVRAPSSATFADLQSSHDALVAIRTQGATGG